jgi:RNA polymerase sigma factor (sigma-70 family)
MNATLDTAPEADDLLLVRFAKGDRLAARTLTLRLAPRCLSLARRMLADAAEAEDVAQEAMLRLWKIAAQWQPGKAQVSTWLYRVTTNLCTDRLRRRRSLPLDDQLELADDTPGIDADLFARDRVAALHLAMQQLPERQRAASALRHFEERSNPEIAAILDLSVEAVESLLARGKRNLTTLLEAQKPALKLV